MCAAMLYQPLNAAANEIRVLEIKPCSISEAPLVCQLQTESLPDATSFHALSYAWGRESPLAALLVNDCIISITPNLERALKAIRRPGINARLWVDALSMNQSDVTERNHQVRLMRQIYTSADKVNVWLGDGFPEVQYAFDILTKLADGTPLRTLLQAKDLGSPRETIGCLGKIFEYSWWNRLWVIQEVILARDAALFCGDHCIAFKVVIQAFENIWNEHISLGREP
jgi:hypothetical protein